MFIKNRIGVLILVVCVALSACGGQATEVPTLDANVVMTGAVNTFVASMNQT